MELASVEAKSENLASKLLLQKNYGRTKISGWQISGWFSLENQDVLVIGIALNVPGFTSQHFGQCFSNVQKMLGSGAWE